MRIRVTETAREAGQTIALDIASGLSSGAIRVLGVATGASPLPIYDELASFAGARARADLELVALDEYVGLAASDPRSFAAYVAERIAAPLGVPPERTHVPSGSGPDADAAADAFEATIRRVGPVDLQILGVGTNGHIGFNEPGSPRESLTRVVTLSERTRRDNAPYFPGVEVPTRAITQGIDTIMRAKRLVVIATGARKAEAVAALVSGVVTPELPVTFLSQHPDLTLVADAAAAGALCRRLTPFSPPRA